MAKIISFDIWDTIIKRKCHPEEIKLHTAKYIILKHRNKLKEKYKNIYEILKKRNEIETEECNKNKQEGKDEECRIEEVFKKLQKEIFKTQEELNQETAKQQEKTQSKTEQSQKTEESKTIEQMQDITQELLKEEIEQEKRAIYINPEILPIFEKYKDLKKYCISDFYMGATSLQELLEYLKVPVKFEKIYSSADYLKTKRTGNLYKIAEEEIGIKPEEHIHVGDNIYSDIETAKNLGIETIKMEKTNFNFVPEPNRKLEFNLENAKRKIETNKNDTKTKEDRIFNSGVDLAPLIYFFGYNIVEYAIKNNISKVYYGTREGETFIKIHELIKKNNPFSVELPECEIVEVSRMATFSASLKEFSIAELLKLWSQYRVQSMKALFKTLAIDITNYKEYLGKYDLIEDENIVEPWFDMRVQKLCNDNEFKQKIQIEIDRKRNELLQYFKQKKSIVNDQTPMFIVDIGWRGTILDNLANIFTNKKIIGYYLALYDFYNLQPANSQKISFIDDKNIRDNEVANIITLLEWIYNPGTGSVVEYKQGEAIRKAKTEEIQIVKEYIKPLQDGMFAGAEIINDYMKYHPYEAQETKQYVYELLRKIKTNPSKELVEAYYKMVFNDTFGTAEYVKKDNKLTTMQKINIFKCRNLLRNETWKEAFVIHNDIKYMNVLTGAKSMARKLLGR